MNYNQIVLTPSPTVPMSRERREDVVTLVRGDPLLEPPDAGLGGDLADDARHAGVEM